jgi:hypothetical protein
MRREIDCLIATGSEILAGPQFLATSTILTLAKALTVRGQRTAILVIDPARDPALVGRDASEDIAIYQTSQPVSTLPALSLALGGPRILVLPNQLAAYDLLQTPGLDVTAWLGEDDLAVLAAQTAAAPLTLWADSRYVASVAQRLTQRTVEAVAPPLGPSIDATTIIADSKCVAAMGARPRDGIALTLALAKARRDLRFVIVEWPHLAKRQRQQIFAQAASCGNIDWRRPNGPGDLLSALAAAKIILVPAMQPIGHRDWICQMRRLGRRLLGSDLGALPDLIAGQGSVLPADAVPADWLQQLERLRDAGALQSPDDNTATAGEIADKLLPGTE